MKRLFWNHDLESISIEPCDPIWKNRAYHAKEKWSLKGYKSKIEASIVLYFAVDMLKLVWYISIKMQSCNFGFIVL